MSATRPGLASYQRVAETIREEIRTGALQVGQKLPGNRGIAEKYNVALGTAQKALGVLQDEGWLIATPSVGVFVNEPPAEETSAPATSDVQRQLDQLHATVADLAERLRRVEGLVEQQS
jgi:GntR family transcriptional regulator